MKRLIKSSEIINYGEHELYDSDEGMIKVYAQPDGSYYLDINNNYDKVLDDKNELDIYIDSVGGGFIGHDED